MNSSGVLAAAELVGGLGWQGASGAGLERSYLLSLDSRTALPLIRVFVSLDHVAACPGSLPLPALHLET